jgi:protein FrlC
MGKNLVHVHISELNRMPPGTSTDFKPMIAALKKVGFDGYLTMEIGLGGRGIDPNVAAQKAYEYMSSIL